MRLPVLLLICRFAGSQSGPAAGHFPLQKKYELWFVFYPIQPVYPVYPETISLALFCPVVQSVNMSLKINIILIDSVIILY
jgi:hypothetical protein